jgi:transcriptional regulator with XRE-family HTH domain
MKIINKLGGPSQVARKLGVTRQAVSKWATTGKIPEGSAYKMLHVFGNLVSKEELGLDEKNAQE